MRISTTARSVLSAGILAGSAWTNFSVSGAEAAAAAPSPAPLAADFPPLRGQADRSGADDTLALNAVVAQLHVLSIRVKDTKTFDEIFLFFRDVLQLPLLYGEESNHADRTHYAGFSAGNMYFEPCGPYRSDQTFGSGEAARFHGLTFTPAGSVAGSAAAFERLKLNRRESVSPAGTLRAVYLNGNEITGERLSFGVGQLTDPLDKANLPLLKEALVAARGGALGVTGVEEIEVGCAGKEARRRWQEILGPVREDGVIPVGSGPGIRVVETGRNGVLGVTLRVKSLDKARAWLTDNNLLGQTNNTSVMVDTARAWNLKISITAGR